MSNSQPQPPPHHLRPLVSLTDIQSTEPSPSKFKEQEPNPVGPKARKPWISKLGEALAAGLLFVGLVALRPQPAIAKDQTPTRAEAATSTIAEAKPAKPRLVRTVNKKMLSQGEREKKDLPTKEGKMAGKMPKYSKQEYMILGESNILKVLDKEPDNEAALRGLVQIRLRRQDYAGCIAPIKHLQELKPGQIDLALLLAQSQIATKDLKGAQESFESILEKEPYNAIALQGIAALMQQRGEGAKIIYMLEEKIATAAKQPQHATEDVANLKLLQGQILTGQGQMDAALKTFDEVMKMTPADFRPHLSKGLVYVMMDKASEAKQCFDKCKELVPEDYPHREDLTYMIARATNQVKMSSLGTKRAGRGPPMPRKK